MTDTPSNPKEAQKQNPPVNDEIVQSLIRGAENIGSLCTSFGLAAGCTTGQIIGAYINRNETGWQQTQRELCTQIVAGEPEDTVLENAGLAQGTRLQCAKPPAPAR
jgi:hypothetical protein